MPPSDRRLTALHRYTDDLDGLLNPLARAALAHAAHLRAGRVPRPAKTRQGACARHLAPLAADLGILAGRWAQAADPEERVTLAELADWHLDPDCGAWPRYPFLRHFTPFADLGPALAAGSSDAARAALDAAALAFADWCKAASRAAGGG